MHITDNDGWAAFHHPVRSGSYELITFSTDMGSDINLRANDGTNCLHIAACYGHLNLCKTLIEKHDFDVNMTANGGWTRLHVSAEKGNYDLIKLFTDKGSDILVK